MTKKEIYSCLSLWKHQEEAEVLSVSDVMLLNSRKDNTKLVLLYCVVILANSMRQ